MMREVWNKVQTVLHTNMHNIVLLLCFKRIINKYCCTRRVHPTDITSHISNICRKRCPGPQRMVALAIFILLSAAAVILAAEVNLSLNPSSKFAQEVQSIKHNVQNREIIIELKPARKCAEPTLWVRLSGISLRILNLLRVSPNQLVYGYPQLVDAGTYFIEVVILMCTTFNPNAYADICLEDVNKVNNVVTLPYKFAISGNATLKANTLQHPRWLIAPKNQSKILPTRYQKIGCNSEANTWCPTQPEDLVQHHVYDWVDRPDFIKSLHKVQSMSHSDVRNNHNHSTIHVCMVGDSHARELTAHGTKLGIPLLKFVHLASSFPNEFELDWLRINLCSYAIVTYGQWPASFVMKSKPYGQDKYQEEMRRVLTLLQHYDRNQTQVFVRSVNYNPLSARITACPPLDYRSPPVIDAYNTVLKQLTKELHLEYIDLNPIMGPLWDSAQDWCHPIGKVATAEIEWILSHILQSSIHHKLGVVLFPAEFPENCLIRFVDGPTVYLYQNNELRAFPNGRTFMALGYDFDDVKVLHVEKRLELKMGAELPSL